MSETVYHIITRTDWAQTQHSVDYRPLSLAGEGFIHFSTAEQVPATSLRHYRDAGELLVMAIAVDRLPNELVWEDLTGTGTYPHLYGPLPLDAVEQVSAYVAGEGV